MVTVKVPTGSGFGETEVMVGPADKMIDVSDAGGFAIGRAGGLDLNRVLARQS